MTLKDLYKHWLDLMPSTIVVVGTTVYSFVDLPKDLFCFRKIKHFSFDGARLEVHLYDR